MSAVHFDGQLSFGPTSPGRRTVNLPGGDDRITESRAVCGDVAQIGYEARRAACVHLGVNLQPLRPCYDRCLAGVEPRHQGRGPNVPARHTEVIDAHRQPCLRSAFQCTPCGNPTLQLPTHPW